MRVRVYLPPLADSTVQDEQGMVELPDGATLDTLLRRLRLPFRRGVARLCMLNHRPASLADPLADGDVVSFFSLFSGG